MGKVAFYWESRNQCGAGAPFPPSNHTLQLGSGLNAGKIIWGQFEPESTFHVCQIDSFVKFEIWKFTTMFASLPKYDLVYQVFGGPGWSLFTLPYPVKGTLNSPQCSTDCLLCD